MRVELIHVTKDMWLYVLDLDMDILEVYHGLEEKSSNHRFENAHAGGVPHLLALFDFKELHIMSSTKFLLRVDDGLCTTIKIFASLRIPALRTNVFRIARNWNKSANI